MLPFVYIFGAEIPLYGTMIVLGLILAVILAVFRAKRSTRVRMLDMFVAALVVFVTSIIGAKVLFWLIDFDFYLGNIELLKESFGMYLKNLVEGGLVFYGGFIGGALGLVWYCRFMKLNIIDYFDAAIPSLPLAHAFGRLGCFCAGCCYGMESEKFGIVFRNALTGVSVSEKVIPTQLIEAVFNLLLCAALLLYARKERKSGTHTGLYMVCYGVFRFFIEYLRGDEIRGAFLGVTTSQWISLALIIPVGILFLCGIGEKFDKKKQKEEGDCA